MKTFTEHGRDVALEDIRDWLQARLPVQPPTHFANAPKHLRAKLLREKVRAFGVKTRWKLIWREELASRLGIPHEDIIRASNYILVLIEQSLMQREPVRLAGFGDFIPRRTPSGAAIAFKACKEWKRDLNPAQEATNLGLRRCLDKRGQLERRPNM